MDITIFVWPLQCMDVAFCGRDDMCVAFAMYEFCDMCVSVEICGRYDMCVAVVMYGRCIVWPLQ